MAQTVGLTLLDSAARTATTYSGEFDWEDAKAILTVDVTAVSATPTITPGLESYDPTSGSWFTLFTAAYAQNPTGAVRYTYVLTDTAFLPAGFTESKQVYLTPRMRLKITHADADSCTYTASFLRVNSNNLGL